MTLEKKALIKRCINGERTLANMDIKWQEVMRIHLRRKRYCDTTRLEQAKQESLEHYLLHLISEYRRQ